MLIRITGNTTLAEIQEEFSQRFSNLRVEFFTDKNHDGVLTADERVRNLNTRVADIRESNHNGVLQVEGLTTVAELERHFRDVFGLYVQVLRKSGGTWLVTTTTDHLTLSEQNNLSGQMTSRVEPDEAADYADSQDLE